ncbi:peptide-methionine (S)-S-oxide reductase [uncultured Lacinutrix sp.]|uniref:peptide-methionine (S)-S-oxide reductase n=1 Tax=uncultured Lacinutrix sp. TaxID=574032 RepID=UPI002615EFE4|nr:peptide-methionine (S)-S-oxide reductase [uncultured Lacinutrix sp.]
MFELTKIAFGGGCHWCTEAVFQSLKGAIKVEQGFVASVDVNNSFSEAVIVHFQAKDISLKTLIEVHLLTHKSTSNHSMREKYRSAIYTFSAAQEKQALDLLDYFQTEFSNQIITQVLPFSEFKASNDAFQNYYLKDPEKPFCKQFINPKLDVLKKKFSEHINI